MKMKDLKWWRIILSVLILVQVMIVFMLISSAKPEGIQISPEAKTEFKPVKIPDEFFFAGEKMPLEQFDVREALDRELLSNAYFHSQTI